MKQIYLENCNVCGNEPSIREDNSVILAECANPRCRRYVQEEVTLKEWNKQNRSFSAEENPDYKVRGFIIANEDLVRVRCPHCTALFAIEETYLEQVDEIVHCPACCIEVQIIMAG